jgi:hypothetical protein
MINNFRTVDTCITCKFHIEDSDYDEPTTYYCNLDDTFNKIYYSKLTYGKEWEKALNWFSSHSVEENSVCDDFIKNVK